MHVCVVNRALTLQILFNITEIFIQCAIITSLFFRLSYSGASGGRRGLRRLAYNTRPSISVAIMAWSGVDRAVVIETYFKNGHSVTTTQRLFRTHFMLRRNATVPDN